MERAKMGIIQSCSVYLKWGCYSSREGSVVGDRKGDPVTGVWTSRMASVSLPVKSRRIKRSLLIESSITTVQQ